MTCKAVQSKLSAYVDGELCGYEMIGIRSHIHDCKRCEQEMAELRGLKWMVGNLPEALPKADFEFRLKSKVLQIGKEPKPRRLPILVIAGAAFFAAMLVSLVTMHPRDARIIAQPRSRSVDATRFDVSRDQAYQAGSDVFNDGSFVITASAPSNDFR